ncbi:MULTISPECIES: hypothetical protein [Methylobacterium]|uniref:Uncharacterized protein n=2 Tax=Methylobacterium TaxID=407 RepID=A0A0C6FX26_9HYPH|nr:hypothetical protein [Methylobacterium aquaticum]BAQ50139.1 hypothetical protein Maq22A_2p41930 [Methylobacterium aquaticum]
MPQLEHYDSANMLASIIAGWNNCLADEKYDESSNPLEIAADLGIILREVIIETKKPFLLRLVDMVLIELGNEISALQSDVQKISLAQER